MDLQLKINMAIALETFMRNLAFSSLNCKHEHKDFVIFSQMHMLG